MTSKDFIQAEAENNDRIVLYREGLFWKAYERSAYAVCTQIRAFKPTRRSLKTLSGRELVSIGFPSAAEEKVLDGVKRIETMPDRLVLSAPQPITGPEFEVWKASVPLAQPRTRKTDDPAGSGFSPSCAVASVAQVDPDFTLSTACAVAERVRRFDLASSTPMECMSFLSEMKKMLANSADYGSIR